MSVSLRFTPTSFLGLPPFGALFGAKRFEPRLMTRLEPAFDKAKIAGTFPRSEAAEPGRPDLNKLLAAVKVAPELPLIEWDGDRTRAAPAPAEAAANDDEEEDPRLYEPRRRKIRDRYISARFPGVARNAADLASASRVVKAARLYFEEEEVDTALELLQLAIEEAPHDSPLWLARLEILFLARDRDGFVAAAREFREAHPVHEQWDEVCRLGRAIAPGEELFGEVSGPRDHEHYGPWPHLPNWIQAPWDLTAEIGAADFHRLMCGAAPAERAA
ncbi:MAG TPA: hypothetical protein VFK48_03655 [Usitatibacter sp.]|nr:hypothetical protein [Usitatibacter sp.]